MKRFAEHFNGLVWTLAGTGLVLITLSGQTRQWGLIISGVALALNLAGIVASEVGDSQEDD